MIPRAIHRPVPAEFPPVSLRLFVPLLVLLLHLAAIEGCSSSEETSKDVLLEQPRFTGGVLLKDSPQDWADRWNRMLEDKERHVAKEALDPAVESREDVGIPPDAQEALSRASWPPDAGAIVNLPRLSASEISDLTNVLARRLETEEGYMPAPPELARAVPALPAGVTSETVLVREAPDGMHILRWGVWHYKAHPPQWVAYAGIAEDGTLAPSPDKDRILTAIQQAVVSLKEMRTGLKPQDLESKVIQLSYIDVSSALKILRGMGIWTVSGEEELASEEVPFESLPLVVELPPPGVESMGIVGKSQIERGTFGSTGIPALSSDLPGEMIASPSTRILVMFHPAHPEQFSRVKTLLADVIDRPARQIFVEGMVVEIDELGLKELGIEWEFRENEFEVILGALAASATDPLDTLDFSAIKDRDFSTEFGVQLRALVVDGKAEILSRPSVLTLNGRQASIRVGQDLPIVTSQEGISGDTSKLSFDFKYVPLGILLNIRPRVTEDGREISLMVDTSVSSRIREADVTIEDENGNVRASAPTVQSRRVQTYARIQNNTPFIIGGLVSRETITVEQKVPILGDIPLLGALFRSKDMRSFRSEVIIVLTPYVIPEELHLSRALPKGHLVDSETSDLFRDAYRIGVEDIADVSFLYRNQRFLTYRDLARKAIGENFRMAEHPAFKPFANESLPGEEVIVRRIVFNALKRLSLYYAVDLERAVVVTSRQESGLDVTFLERMLARRKVGEEYDDFFSDHPGKALALTYHGAHESPDQKTLVSDPIPEVTIIDCPDRKEWRRLLWEMNQPGPDGKSRHTILLADEEDLERLQVALLTRFVISVNGGRENDRLLNYLPGRVIQIPEIEPEQIHILGPETAFNFFASEHFYTAALRKIETALLDLDQALRTPEFEHLTEGVDLPPLEARS